MRSFYFLILALFPITATFAIDDWPLSNPINEEEALTLRRIADFWQEGEYTIAKSQMEEFLAEFPESGYIDPIRACLGDLLLREKNYSGALSAYSALTSSALKEKTFLKRIQCLYCLEWYATLADECEHFLENTPENEAKIQATYYLAIALYQQCLNAKKHPEILLKLAHRVEPYFQTLMHSDLSIEAAAAFAHLCCILKEYEKAAEMYLSFAKRAPDIAEEMLFQAAQIQTEYDKNLALQSYAVITKQGGKKAAEAAYHHLAISFEMGEFQKIIENQSAILESLSNDRKPLAHFFFGRSYLALSQYNEAISECSSFLENAQS
ncbi:MAG: hypothetical protein FJZ64_01390, partial [Chlamydiae bacterium]|nr:hypothetical protein [Chlamydiota bacterium]